MKKIIAAVLILGIVSCGTETPRFDVPFVVRDIESYDEKSVIYTGDPQEGNTGGFYITPDIIAERGKYNVGDTIKLSK